MCCDIPMLLQSHTGRQFVNSFCWACCIYRCQRAVTNDLFFVGSQLKLPQLLYCIYWWLCELKLAGACVETGVGHTSMVQWCNFICNICYQYLLNHPVIMGRPSCTVEIDESKFTHRMYHCSHYHESRWVLSMVEHETNVCMMVVVPDCTAATLLPIIA